MDIKEKLRILSSLKLGDIVRCINDKDYEFIRMKKAKFIGRRYGTSYDIPVEMFSTIVRLSDKTPFDASQLQEGELFYVLNNKKEAIIYHFKYMINANKVMAENPITGVGARIPSSMAAGTVREMMR